MMKISKAKDLELCKAYQLGINDERKQWQEVKKENALLKYLKKNFESFCFCKGDPLWRWACAECQNWLKDKYKQILHEINKDYKKSNKHGDFVYLENLQEILNNSIAPRSNLKKSGRACRMKIDLFNLMNMNKIFDYDQNTTTEPQTLEIEINKKFFKKKNIEKFNLKFLELEDLQDEKKF